jgi:hypothetical protein
MGSRLARYSDQAAVSALRAQRRSDAKSIASKGARSTVSSAGGSQRPYSAIALLWTRCYCIHSPCSKSWDLGLFQPRRRSGRALVLLDALRGRRRRW